MNRYSLSKFRLAFGIGAFALSAFTMALTVVVPASLSTAGGTGMTDQPRLIAKA